MELADEAARNIVRTVLDRNIIVEAAAGTGKTTELVTRIVALLGEGKTTIDRILAVTFTDKAAGELKLRIHAKLEEAREETVVVKQRGLFEHALTHLDQARISTIHALCTDLLRERPVEAGIDPEFDILTDSSGRRVYQQAFQTWFQRVLKNPPKGLRRFLRRRTRKPIVDVLVETGWKLAEWRDYSAAWEPGSLSREKSIDALTTKLHELAALTESPGTKANKFYQTTKSLRSLSAHIRLAESVRSRDYDDLEATYVRVLQDEEFRSMRQPAEGPEHFNSNILQTTLQAKHGEWMRDLETFVTAANADLASALQADLMESTREYETLKNRNGQLDFLDLLITTRNLLLSSESVRQHFQERFTHILVDEFQDTDPIQAEILLLLSSSDPKSNDWHSVTPVAGKLFLVGDPKQAIYRFRRADIRTYNEVKTLMLKQGAELVQLTTSFRAGPNLQRLINAAFNPAMSDGDREYQADYVPLTPFRKEHAVQPSVVALSVPEVYGSSNFNQKTVADCLPDTVAGFIEWMLRESGWTVAKRDSLERHPVTESDVCILFKRLFDGFNNQDIARPYIQALEARNIPHLLVGGKSFYSREEIQTLHAALTAIEWPDDELAVFATLKGSLFAIRDDHLLQYRDEYKHLHPFRTPTAGSPAELEPIVRALAILRQLHLKRNSVTVAETIEHLLRQVRIYPAFAVRPSGEQVLANILRFIDLSRKYEISGGLSFRGFVKEIEEAVDAQETSEAPLWEEGNEGVKLMSVHKAKGLEFPVVVLADITAPISGSRPNRYVDNAHRLCAIPLAGCVPLELQEHTGEELARDRAEGVRLAYVAATRAKDLLVVPTIGDHPFRWKSLDKWWVRPLYEAFYPTRELYRRSEPAPGCPAFGSDSVVERPNPITSENNTVRPGLHRIGSSDSRHDVVWWDPSILKRKVPRSFGVRQQALLQEILSDGDANQAQTGQRAYDDWRSSLVSTREIGSVPHFVVDTVTSVTRKGTLGTTNSASGEVELIELENPRIVGGIRFGILVHQVLSTINLNASSEEISAVADVTGRILGAAEEEIASAQSAISNALVHSVIARARTAGECRRETPLTFQCDDGTILEGVVDLAFLENGTWYVVDFKTDRGIENELEKYKRQVSLYCRVISRATGLPARGILMRV